METSDRRKITLWIGHDALHRLNEISDETGAPVAELIRRAVASYLDTRSTTNKGTRKKQK